MTAQSFYRRVHIEARRPSLADTSLVTGVVVHALRDRRTPDEADHAVAQLPRPLELLPWAGLKSVWEDAS